MKKNAFSTKTDEYYASFCTCVLETSMKICKRKTKPADEWRKDALGVHVVHARELAENDGALLPEQWKEFEPVKKLERSAEVTYDAVRLKKVRLKKTAYTMVGLHGNRCRFITITVRENCKDKKDFYYQVENLRKELRRKGYSLNYSGMAERQGRGAWHIHAIAYLTEDDWNYKEIQAIAVRRGMNIDMKELRNKCKRASKKLSDYMLKLDAAIKSAYAAKMLTGEDYVYTLTSKGCDKPKRKTYNAEAAFRFIQGYGFEPKEYMASGGELFYYYLSENSAFGRALYDSC